MANMSYCRFHNTRLALADCLRALDPCENEYEISAEEVKVGQYMFREFLEFCEANEIIEGYSYGRVKEVFEEFNAEIAQVG